MSHHLFLLSPSDTPLYSLTHQSTKPAPTASSPLAANLPTWSTSAFAGTLTALSGASSATQHTTSGPVRVGGGQDRHVIQMIANASLDAVEDVMQRENGMYLKAVDKFNEWTVSAFVTPGNMKFLLLHESKNDDGIRGFFMEVWELYVKTLLNPFHTAHTPVRSGVFDSRVRACAKNPASPQRVHHHPISIISPPLSVFQAMSAQPHNRASLLAGLRTGGVRSSSLNIPHTAAPTGSFNIPRITSYNNPNVYYEEEEDQLADMQPQVFNNRAMPMTAAVDGPHNRFAQQQTRMMNPNSVPFSPGFAPNVMQQQQQFNPQNAMQMQMLQIEMLKIQQALQVQQAQQLQAEMLAQAQRQQQFIQAQQARERRTSLGFNPPATAGPMTNSFDIRPAPGTAQMRRANQADQLRAQLGVAPVEDQVPMTAALGGRFGSRTTSVNVSGEDYGQAPPPTPHSTTVISGGTSLGAVQSKSDAASSWRRGGNNNSVLSGNRAVSSPAVKITPPPAERISPPPGISTSASSNGPKFRPQPLRFSAAVSQSIPAVTIDTTDDDTDAETQSSGSSVKSSSPTTPRSSSSNEMPLSPREEASKKLYEGLGIGRPVSANSSDAQVQQIPIMTVANHRMVSQPTRQPRGPPSGTEELGPKNFATRIRRKAIGGLGALMDARERREVEAF